MWREEKNLGAVKWDFMNGFLLYAVSPVLLSELLPFKSSCSLTVVVGICLILVHTCLFVTIVTCSLINVIVLKSTSHMLCFREKMIWQRACLHGGGAPQVGEVKYGGSPHLSCKRDRIKMRDYMDKRVTPPKRVTSPTMQAGLKRNGGPKWLQTWTL